VPLALWGRLWNRSIDIKDELGPMGQRDTRIFEAAYFFLTIMRSGVPVKRYVSRSWFSKYFRYAGVMSSG